MSGLPDLERAFNPRAIAIVGVSRSAQAQHFGTSGLSIMRALIKAGYAGHLYPINPKAGEIDGIKVYASLRDVPENIDLVIVAVPAAIVPQVLEDCIAVHARNVHVCSSGFSETGEEEGRQLEEKVKQIALRGGLRLLGPNCMGIQVPKVGVTTFEDENLADGPVGFISQSGGHAHRFLQYGPTVGVGFSKVISIGNAVVMDTIDFLEYLGSDADTKIICLYLEGARQGGKLTRLVKKINRVKPVVIWKGGLTDFGARAAASHTGSLAGNRQLWDAFFKQTGAIQVSSIEEMAEVCAAFIHLPPPSGNRAVIITGGGGNNVAAGDIAAEEGLQLPPLSQKTKQGLRRFISFVNQGLNNPLEAASLYSSPEQMTKAMNLFNADASIDIIIVSLLMSRMEEEGMETATLKCLSGIARDKKMRKLIVLTITDPATPKIARYWQRVSKAGILWYPTIRQACRAIRKYTFYYEFLKKKEGCS